MSSSKPSLRRTKRRSRSQDSESSETSREVRCACQFYMSEELLPEHRFNPVGTPIQSHFREPQTATGSSGASSPTGFTRYNLQQQQQDDYHQRITPVDFNRMSPVMFHNNKPNSNYFCPISDHEYEPVSAPSIKNGEKSNDLQQPATKNGPPIVKVLEPDLVAADNDDVSSVGSVEQKFLRIPLDDELVVPEDGQSEDAAMSSEGIEDRFLNATPTTIGSRTDHSELHTSQVDSSGLETLPLQRENRKRATLATEEDLVTQNIGQRIRTSANRLKTRIRDIRKKHDTERPAKENKKPKVERERPKRDRPSLLQRAKKIERPKFTMPKMPERPKFNLPKMPEFPKMPERKKINISMPKMPDISMPKMPDMPKMPKMPDFSSLGRTKQQTPKSPNDAVTVVQTTTTTTTSDPTSEASSEPPTKTKRFDFGTYPKMLTRKNKPTKKVITETITTSRPSDSTESDPKPKSNLFQSIPDWVTLPRKSKKLPAKKQTYPKEPLPKKQYVPSNINGLTTEEPIHIPLREATKSDEDIAADKVEEVIQEIDQNNILFEKVNKPKLASEENIDDVNDIETPPVYERDIETPSPFPLAESVSGEVLPHENAGRRGVIEEINADEFFVREKGLSQDNIDVSMYLSSEIREAFQQPQNTLADITTPEYLTGYFDYDKNLEEDYSKMRDSPEIPEQPPTKTLRKKKKSLAASESQSEQIVDNQVDSTPPSRPSRSRKGSMSSRKMSVEEVPSSEPPSRPSRSRKGSIATPERPKSTTSCENFDNYKTYPGSRPERPTRSRSRKGSLTTPVLSRENLPNIPKQATSCDNIESYKTYSPPRRPSRSRSRSKKSSLAASPVISKEHIDAENFKTYPPPSRPSRSQSRKSISSQKYQSQSQSPIHFIDESLKHEPQAPIRRKRSSRSLNVSEQNINGALEHNISLQDLGGIPPIPKRRSHSRSTIHTINDDDRTSRGAESIRSDDRVIPSPVMKSATPPGYAKVEKNKYNHPEPAKPPPRRKRKKLRETQFFTVPRRLKDDESTPQRPIRNYSTLRSSTMTGAHISDKENYDEDEPYIEIDDEDVSHKKLQSGEIIQKMKTRPLPAPPRPPRRPHRRMDYENHRDNVLKEIQPQVYHPHVEETILKEVHHQQYLEPTPLRDEDKNDLHKASNESIVKGTLFLGANQVNIVTEVQEPEIPQSELETRLNKQNERMKTPVRKSKTPQRIVEPVKSQVIEVEMSTQTDPLPDDFVCEEVVAEPTDIILMPTNRRTITEQISFEMSDSMVSSALGTPDIGETRRGILEQQSHERLSESPAEQAYDETYLKDNAIRLARSEQSTLISRPVAEDETVSVPQQPPPSQVPMPSGVIPTAAVALPESLRVERLQVSDLDVDRLTVSELMAQKILVSEIDGMSLKIQDISSNSGTLTTDEIKLPPNLIEEILSKLQSLQPQPHVTPEPPATSHQEPVIEKRIIHMREESTNTDESLPQPLAPQTPTIPHLPVAETTSASIPPMESTQEEPTPSTSTATAMKPPQNLNEILQQAATYPHIYIVPPSFYQQSQPSTSSSEHKVYPDPGLEDAHPDPSIPNLSIQLLRACHASFTRTVRQVIIELSSRLNSGDEKQDARTAIIIVVVLIAALIFLSFTSGNQSVHHHHWEYFAPPDGGGRPA